MKSIDCAAHKKKKGEKEKERGDVSVVVLLFLINTYIN
jgi:hypothetical protein